MPEIQHKVYTRKTFDDVILIYNYIPDICTRKYMSTVTAFSISSCKILNTWINKSYNSLFLITEKLKTDERVPCEWFERQELRRACDICVFN